LSHNLYTIIKEQFFLSWITRLLFKMPAGVVPDTRKWLLSKDCKNLLIFSYELKPKRPGPAAASSPVRESG
jgi:hypothetical protein